MERQINILISSAGRRVELIQCFRNAAEELHLSSVIVATDTNYLSPALYFADKHYVVSQVCDENYLSQLINICNSENIALIVPTIDTELSFLAKNKAYIESETGAIVLVSSLDIIMNFESKSRAYEFFLRNNVPTPEMLEPRKKNIIFPIFIKPDKGSSSANAYKVENYDQLKLYLDIVPNPICQQFVSGEEYSIDAFLDFNSKVVSIVPRLRISTRAGEIQKGKVVYDENIIFFARNILSKAEFIGPITIQIFKTFNELVVIEINPRYGGGTPMSIYSGANSPKFLYQLLLGEEIQYKMDSIKDTIFLRFDKSMALPNENE